jgi:hypothetical protein
MPTSARPCHLPTGSPVSAVARCACACSDAQYYNSVDSHALLPCRPPPPLQTLDQPCRPQDSPAVRTRWVWEEI